MFKLIGLDVPTTGLVVEPSTVVWSYVVGVVVTMLSAYLPVRRAARVAPMAALREDGAAAVERSLRWRI